jgi:hypothetical protein
MALRAYQRWSYGEDCALIDYLHRRRPMSRIINVFQRSEGSIRSRIMHLYKNNKIRIELIGGGE